MGQRLSLAEQINQHRRELRGTSRLLASEINELEYQQRDATARMNEAAQKGDRDHVRMLAKQYIRMKRQIKHFRKTQLQVQGIEMTMNSARSQDMIGKSLKDATKVMTRLSGTVQNASLQETIRNFTMEMDRMNMATEIMDDTMDDTMDDAFSDEDSEEETEEKRLVDQVMDQAGLDQTEGVFADRRPQRAPRPRVEEEEEEEAEENEMQ